MERLRPGDHLAGYRVLATLGVGGMGTVYLADAEQAAGRVALKVLPPQLASDPGFRKRFLRESAYAGSVEHPNVVRVLDAGEAAGALFMAMEYVEGGDLAALLAREGEISAARAVGLLGQAALALDAVHAAGLVHRDVKPANLIVTGSAGAERVLLTDFGLSRSPATDSVALTATGDYVGTHHYTAPEQILGGEPDRRADVYSLACVLLECLTGKPPFPLEAGSAVLEAHVDSPPPALRERRPDLPGALSAVIARALSKSPADRFPSCGELISAAAGALRATRVVVKIELDIDARQGSVVLGGGPAAALIAVRDGRWRLLGAPDHLA